ncbi:MAG: antibiotic biosynthesis monooxygenase [Sphingomonadales bacterium]
MPSFIKAPEPPYFAVIFTSTLRDDAAPGYEAMAEAMFNLAQKQPGYLGFETAHGEDGLGVTVSYWKDEASIKSWKAVARHQAAQNKGKADWYAWFHVRVAKVERGYSFEREE